MKIEILYPEIANLNGDMANMKYLKRCLPQAQLIETSLDQEPAFNSENVSLIYMGSLSEKSQEIVIEKLKPYKNKIEELIEKEQVFLFTGNSIEIFGKYIENEDGTKVEALGIFDVYSKRDMLHRHNSFFLGKYEQDLEIVGFKSQFTMMYGDNSKNSFIKVEKGIGINKESGMW